MKIYYSNMDEKFEWPYSKKLGVLGSYYGMKKIPYISFCDSYFLDSGAFSAWRQNKIIDIEKYCEFVDLYKDRTEVYSSLDVIGKESQTKSNYLFMLREGFFPLPCFHIQDSFDLIEIYLRNTDYIALGGIALLNKKVRIRWLDKVFSLYPSIKFHGFGIQDRDILRRYAWYSVDSSSWHIMARFGGICCMFGNIKVADKVNFKELRWATPINLKVVRAQIESFGIDFELCRKSDITGNYWRQIVNILYYEKLVSEFRPNYDFPKKKSFFI